MAKSTHGPGKVAQHLKNKVEQRLAEEFFNTSPKLEKVCRFVARGFPLGILQGFSSEFSMVKFGGNKKVEKKKARKLLRSKKMSFVRLKKPQNDYDIINL